MRPARDRRALSRIDPHRGQALSINPSTAYDSGHNAGAVQLHAAQNHGFAVSERDTTVDRTDLHTRETRPVVGYPNYRSRRQRTSGIPNFC